MIGFPRDYKLYMIRTFSIVLSVCCCCCCFFFFFFVCVFVCVDKNHIWFYFLMEKILFVLIPFQKIAEMAHAHGALLLVDNSIMSPVLSQPLTLGAGYEHSA